jgi:hypothetical protein
MEGARIVSASGEGRGDSPVDAFIRTVIDGAAQYEHGLRSRRRSTKPARSCSSFVRATRASMCRRTCDIAIGKKACSQVADLARSRSTQVRKSDANAIIFVGWGMTAHGT